MCGVAGFWQAPDSAHPESEQLLDRMTDCLAHRGPDDAGSWLDPEVGVGLGHRRLSIIDLSPLGHQPMFSGDGRFVISFNGEIFNFLDLRKELEAAGHAFRSNADTEVILEAVSYWGFDRALARLAGMFAFALWDRKDRRLYLVRDRLGKKPMYLYRGKERLLFASELKSLCAHASFPRVLDQTALGLFFRYGYIPSPWSIYRDTCKILPGQFVVIGAMDRGGPGVPEFRTYWDALSIAREARRNPIGGGEAEVLALTENLLMDAVQRRMISDVPLGVLLSGGIDSSAIAALMQKASSRPVRSFTIGFREQDFNEAGYARGVAKHLGTDHTELFITPRETLEVVPRLAEIYDEPFADSSQIPTWAVSKLARSQVTVALSGDGGDELFGGYNRYSLARRTWNSVGWVPTGLRRLLSKSMLGVPPGVWDRFYGMADPVLPHSSRMELPSDKIYKFAQILESPDGDLLYRHLVSYWMRPGALLVQGAMDIDADDPLVSLQGQIPLRDLSERMMLLDLKTYLPEDILVKVDRASMSVGLEMRAPFLDHRVVELLWRLPLSYKIRGRSTKWLLRKILYQYVPPELVDRPKVGFGLPVGEWLRGPLKEWAETLLSPSRLDGDGVFQSSVVRHYWQEHVRGGRDWKYHLWPILMFQTWKDMWQPQIP